jgi:MYXO-CTERM domain-containing protein
MIIKLTSSLIFGAGLVLAMPPVPELPMADTGAAIDTGAATDTGDTDTGDPDTGDPDTGDTDAGDTDTGNTDTGDTLNDTGSGDSGSIGTGPTEVSTAYSASQLAGEKGAGCSATGAPNGPWFLALLGLLIGRRRE